MKKDFLTSDKLCFDDSDFDFSEETLTFQKTVSHENRFQSIEKNLKNNENKRNQEIMKDNRI